MLQRSDRPRSQRAVAVCGLRAHPGGTPEAGATARTALPREAKEFDRLRGGKDLSAVFKRGKAAQLERIRAQAGLSADVAEVVGKALD